MAYKEKKVEDYQNIGGINQKASVYITGEKEVLGLQNYDFSTPGAWTKRWGYTGAFNGNTIGASFRINAIWQLFKPGTYAFGDLPALFPNLYTFVGTDKGIFNYLYDGSSHVGLLYPGITYGGTLLGNIDWEVWNAQNYIATGIQGYKINPNYLDANSFPIPYFYSMADYGTTLSNFQNTGAGGLSGTYNLQIAYRDINGFIGAKSATLAFAAVSGGQTSSFHVTFNSSTLGSATLFGFYDYVLFSDRVTGFASTDMIAFSNASPGASLIYLSTNRNATPLGGVDIDQPIDNQYSTLGKYVSTYKNRLFSSGYDVNTLNGNTSASNTVNYSEIGELENVQPENNFIVSKDKFEITGQKPYNQCLLFFLQRGVFRLTGDSPDNFNVQEMNGQYGAVSNKAIVEWKERLWFLDEYGIVEFNGANFDKISNRVDGIMQRMNIRYARERAVGYHYEERNEVWFTFPVDDEVNNNITVVYDYLAEGFTTFTGFAMTGIGDVYLGFNNTDDVGVFYDKRLFFGTVGSSMYFFGPSFFNDGGNGITLSFNTRNHTPFGKSSTAQFRRFYLDTGPSLGSTLTFHSNFYANYSTQTISLTRTLYSNSPNYRIDFGIPATALSAEVIHASDSGTVKVYGYTVESRFQRAVSS